jgi:DNA replication protein DnaC
MRSKPVPAVEYDPSLPPCPLCGAAALKSSYRFAEDLSHDCECLVTQEAAYYRGLRNLWKGRVESERFVAALPPRYRFCRLEGYLPTPASQEALNACRELRMGDFLYLHGRPGRGKTHLAVGAAYRLARQGHRALFLGEAAYLEALYRSFRGGGEPPDYSGAEVLVLDDLGKIKPSEFAYQTLYALLEHANAYCKTLIVTSNYEPGTAAWRISGSHDEAAEAILSRLAQGYVVEVGGEDRRLKN